MTKFYSIILLFTLIFLQPTFLCNAQTYNGSVVLTNQAEVDSFGALGYSRIAGHLEIGPDTLYPNVTSNITDLTSLLSLHTIDSSLLIESNHSLTSLSGLDSISHIGDFLTINSNYGLQNLYGLGNIDTLYGLSIGFNIGLQNLNGLENLTHIEFALNTIFCSSLTSFSGLDNLTYAGNVQIAGSENVQNLEAFGSLTTVDELFQVFGPSKIESLSGLENLTSVHSMYFADNQKLNDYCALTDLVDNSGIINFATSGNDYNPTLQQLEDGDCNSTLGINDHILNAVILSPNPTTGNLTIELGGINPVNLRVINQLGQVIYKRSNILESTFSFNLDAPQGLYTVEVFSTEIKKQFKVINL